MALPRGGSTAALLGYHLFGLLGDGPFKTIGQQDFIQALSRLMEGAQPI